MARENRLHFAADFLVDKDDPEWVTDMYYRLDGEEDGELSYRDFILLLVKELQVNRQHGYVRLYLYGKKSVPYECERIAIFIRKRDLYVIGVQDNERKVYEVGKDDHHQRYFFGSTPTGFGEHYSELFPNNRDLRGIQLGYMALHDAISRIICNPADPLKWSWSIGVFTLMWSECARFKWFQDVLFVVMRNHPTEGDLERFAPVELRGSIRIDRENQYGFMSVLRRHWKYISECARKAVDHQPYDPQPDNEKYTEAGIENLKRNPGWAKDSLSILKWKEGDPEYVHLPGEGYGLSYGEGGGFHSDQIREIKKLEFVLKRMNRADIYSSTSTTMAEEPTTRDQVIQKYGRIMLITEIHFLLNEALQSSFRPHLEDQLCVCEPLEGDLKKYGDYQCTNILSVCEILRAKIPNLFENNGPRSIAEVIRRNFRESEMIKELIPRDIGILTFKLDGDWMAKRIYENLKRGIDAWAPISSAKKIIVDFSTPYSATKMHADGVRSRYIKDTLVRMLEYSEATVIDKEITEESRREVEEACKKANEFINDDLVALWSGIKKQKVEWIVFVTPLRQRDYIMKRFDTATRLSNEDSTTMSYLGYHTSSNEQGKLASFWNEYEGNSDAKDFVDKYGKDGGYSAEQVLEGHIKYTYLKKNRFSDCTLKVDEMFKEKENNFANLLKTQALIRSAIKDCVNRGVDVPKEQDALVGKQRELGLQLLQFTEVIEESFLTFMPHLVCEYVWSLSENVTRYLEDEEVLVLLCEATKEVMEKCFDILGITLKYLNQQSFRDIFPDFGDVPVDVVAVSDTRPKYLNSRFELFSMFIGVSHSNFEKGNLFGNITLSDTYGLLSDSWCKIDENDRGHVAYFDHDWHDSVGIYSTSFLSFGNPSFLHSVPFSSLIEIGVHLFVTTEKKDACYQLCNCEHEINLSQFWEGKKSIERGTFNVEGKDGSVSIYYVLLKDALDISMTLEYKPVVGDPKVHRIRGRILAYYGGDFLETCDGFKKESYKALIFHIEPYKLETGPLPLKKSQLAVPTNAVLVIEAFLEDVDSKEIIEDKTYEYRAEREGKRKLPMGGINCHFELTVDWIQAETKPMGGLEGARPLQPMAEQPSTSKSK